MEKLKKLLKDHINYENITKSEKLSSIIQSVCSLQWLIKHISPVAQTATPNPPQPTRPTQLTPFIALAPSPVVRGPPSDLHVAASSAPTQLAQRAGPTHPA